MDYKILKFLSDKQRLYLGCINWRVTLGNIWLKNNEIKTDKKRD